MGHGESSDIKERWKGRGRRANGDRGNRRGEGRMEIGGKGGANEDGRRANGERWKEWG